MFLIIFFFSLSVYSLNFWTSWVCVFLFNLKSHFIPLDRWTLHGQSPMRHSLSNLLCSTAPTGDRPIGLFGRLASLSAGHLPEDSSSTLPSAHHHLHSHHLLPTTDYSSESRRAKSNAGLARLTAVSAVTVAKQSSTKKNGLTLTPPSKTIIDTSLGSNNNFGAFNRHISSNSSAGSAASSSGASSQLSHSDPLEPDDDEEEASVVAAALVGDDRFVSRLSHSSDLTTVVGVGQSDGAAALDEIFNYCHPRNTILVKLKRSVRGFGIALCGGWKCDLEEREDDLRTDTSAGRPFSQLIRVKRLYPAQPAAESGLIDEDDIILEANSTCFVGLTNIVSTEIEKLNLVNWNALKPMVTWMQAVSLGRQPILDGRKVNISVPKLSRKKIITELFFATQCNLNGSAGLSRLKWNAYNTT